MTKRAKTKAPRKAQPGVPPKAQAPSREAPADARATATQAKPRAAPGFDLARTGGPQAGPAFDLARWGGLLLAAAVILVYAPSLRGGFLNYDDPWLVRDNPVLRDGSGEALVAIWSDFSESARMKLGAEYLPVRDTVEWLEARVHGLEPHAMRALSLFLYAAAAVLLRRYLRAAFGPGFYAEAIAWLFALHPVHAESVAWLAGRKDVLALLFSTWALAVHAGPSRRRAEIVPLLVLLACLSKSVAVVTPLLLVLHDLLTGQRPALQRYLPSLAVAGVAAALTVDVGAVVHMTTAPIGGGRLATAATMGPVSARYLMLVVWPPAASLSHDVTVRGAGDVMGWLGYGPLLAWAAAGALAWRRGSKLPLVALGWFVVPLLPTSQIAFPLQNQMADRYLLVAVLGPAALVVFALGRGRAGMAAVAVLVAALGGAAAWRSALFADDIALWRDATRKTARSTTAPYELAMALQEAKRDAEAEASFRETMRRAESGDDHARKAANNLAGMLGRDPARAAEAEQLLREAVARFPNDPKVLNNLAESLARRGQMIEARRLYDDLVRRFPAYETGRRNYTRRFGPPPPAAAAP